MKKFVSILLVAVLICTALVSCGGGGKKETQKATVKVSIYTDDAEICENVEVTVQGYDGNPPYAYDAIINALNYNEIPFKTEKLGSYDRITEIDGNGLTGADGEEYVWELVINKKDVEGRMNVAEIKDGDVLILSRNIYESVISTDEVTTVATTEAPVETADDGFEE